MELRNACLVIADISGYTRFLLFHTTALLHAEMIITDLLEGVIAQSSHPLTIAKLEGDAVFLYALVDDDPQIVAREVLKQVAAFFDAFRTKERELIACNICACTACRSIEKLTLKVFLHYGEVAVKQVSQFTELAGGSVILIHRLLKNSIPSKEYLLMTGTFYALSGGLEDQALETRTEHAEDIGDVEVKVYYPPANINFPPRPPLILPKPGTKAAILQDRLEEYSQRRLKGLEPQRQFSSLPELKITPLTRLSHFIPHAIGGLHSRINALIYHLFGWDQ